MDVQSGGKVITISLVITVIKTENEQKKRQLNKGTTHITSLFRIIILELINLLATEQIAIDFTAIRMEPHYGQFIYPTNIYVNKKFAVSLGRIFALYEILYVCLTHKIRFLQASLV